MYPFKRKKTEEAKPCEECHQKAVDELDELIRTAATLSPKEARRYLQVLQDSPLEVDQPA